MKKFILSFCIVSFFSSCACQPEDMLEFAFSGMESLIGEGFLPSDEILALGDFQGMSIQIGQTSEDGVEESVIFLRLENGDPDKLSGQREVLARKCAELYLRDFEKSQDYQKITIQFIQTDPQDAQNVAMEEYTFDVSDF